MASGHRFQSLVMDRSNDLAGILSIMDLIAAIRPAYLSAPKPSTRPDQSSIPPCSGAGCSPARPRAWPGMRVADIMSPPPPSVDGDANLMEMANLLYERECRRLVVRSAGRVMGVVREQEIFFRTGRTGDRLIPGTTDRRGSQKETR